MVTLNFENLEYVCQKCHTQGHLRKQATKEGLMFDNNGNLIKVKNTEENIYLPKIIQPMNKTIYIICGAPGSGKSTYVNQNATKDDIILDLDNILLEFTNGKIYDSAEIYLEEAIKKRNYYLNNLNNMKANRVWFIVSAPTAEERKHWKEQLNGTIILMDTNINECLNRIRQDKRRSNNVIKYSIAVNKWFKKFNEGFIDKKIPPI